MAIDHIFADPRIPLDFAFNAEVANVFSDMINRSVPGYASIVENIGILAANLVQDGDTVYDLGCSLGAVSFAIAQNVPNCKIVAVDNSAAMITKCRQNLGYPNVKLQETDILDLTFEPAKLVVLNFTLQFIAPHKRLFLLTKIYQALQNGGILILAEKIKFDDVNTHHFINELHLNFKRAQGYSELEIAQKRNSLEKVLIPNTADEHIKRLEQAGFNKVIHWFNCLNFASFLAIK